MKKIYYYLIILASAIPFRAGAQGGGGNWCDYEFDSIADIFHLIGCILAVAVLPTMVTLAVVVFIIGVIKYIINADEAAKREEGRKFMIYGIIALFVMVSVWGLVGIIQGTFGLGTSIFIPQLPTG
jgi:hypothetical protein